MRENPAEPVMWFSHSPASPGRSAPRYGVFLVNSLIFEHSPLFLNPRPLHPHPLPADALSPLPRGTHRWPLRSPHFPFSSVPEEEPFVPLNLRSSFSSGIIRLLLPAQAACSFNSFSTSAGSATSAYNQAPASPV